MNMTIRNSERTHCVTFIDDGRAFYAVKSRQYGDQVPMGVSQPTVACAMPEKDAKRLAEFLRKEAVNFTNIKVNRLSVKGK
jgi:hypothetical protein